MARVPAVWEAAPVPQIPRRTVNVTTPPASTGSATIWAISSSSRTHDTKSWVFAEWAPAASPVPRELTNGHVVGAPVGRDTAALATRRVVVAASTVWDSRAAPAVSSPMTLGLAFPAQNVPIDSGARVSMSAASPKFSGCDDDAWLT